MTEADLAWIAGLLEGEGCFSHKGSGTKRNVVVVCHMTDRDVLEKLQTKLGVGRVHGPYANGAARNKPRFMFAVSGPSAYGVMVRLFPLMCSRRQARMRELMEGFESVKATVYRIENVVTGDIQEVTKLKQWLQAHGLSETGLWRTLVGERKQCKGWRRLS